MEILTFYRRRKDESNATDPVTGLNFKGTKRFTSETPAPKVRLLRNEENHPSKER